MSDANDLEEPWYKDGLRFRCTRCGKCCTGAPGFVWVTPDEVTALAEFRGEPRDELEGLYTRLGFRGRTLREKANGDCVFYDRARGCTVYPVRPRQCRTFPFWESNVKTPRDWEQTCQACPGAGKGDLISAEEIAERLKVIRL
jgi:Fe-S-cluster containining protein